jgi:hypothetical protein
MRIGQHVRVRHASPLAIQYRIQPDAQGVVLCQYQVLARGAKSPQRLDIRLTEGRVIWGVPADAFEAIECEMEKAG